MSIIENFYEDLLFDLEYLEWKRDQEMRAWAEWVEEKEIEEQAYDIMADEHFRELEKYKTLIEEKEYRKISEWELINQL